MVARNTVDVVVGVRIPSVPLMLITLYVCSACNLKCRNCNAMHLMAANPRYQMSLEELDYFIKVSCESGYKYDMWLTGGEPLLWVNLLEGVQRLRRSGIIKTLHVNTNAIHMARLTPEMLRNIDFLHVSLCKYNLETAKLLQQRLAKTMNRVNLPMLDLIDRRTHWLFPESPLPNTLPPLCRCPNAMVYDGRVHFCVQAKNLCLRYNLDVPFEMPLEVGFGEKLKAFSVHESPLCSVCVSNGKVQNQVPKITNTSLLYEPD